MSQSHDIERERERERERDVHKIGNSQETSKLDRHNNPKVI